MIFIDEKVFHYNSLAFFPLTLIRFFHPTKILKTDSRLLSQASITKKKVFTLDKVFCELQKLGEKSFLEVSRVLSRISQKFELVLILIHIFFLQKVQHP